MQVTRAARLISGLGSEALAALRRDFLGAAISEFKMFPDQLPWIPIAKAVMAGAYDKADRSVKQAIAMGCRTINHPDAKAAYERLKDSIPKTKQ